jgi:hypothetical protein
MSRKNTEASQAPPSQESGRQACAVAQWKDWAHILRSQVLTNGNGVKVMRKLIFAALSGLAWRWFQKRNRATAVRRSR